MKNTVVSVDQLIFSILRSSRRSAVFSPRQLEKCGSSTAVRKALSRLVKSGKIRRIRQGLYDLPRSHPIIGQTTPNPMAVVRTLMDGSSAQWQFSGAYAANALGLSEQVPAKIVILTNGVPRRMSLGKLTLAFRRAAPRNMLGAGRRSGLVFQAFRYLHGSSAMSRHIARLKKDLDVSTKRDLMLLIPKMPAWMRPLVQEIVRK